MTTSAFFEPAARMRSFLSARATKFAALTTNKYDPHGRELFLNHVWESLTAGAKILFFAVVTPMMLSTWGEARFGLFAVANSCVALMAITDLGLRMVTRVALSNRHLSDSAKLRLHAANFAAFVLAAGAATSIVALLALAGFWHRFLRVPDAGDFVIATTVLLTAVMMSLQLLVEPLAAAGHLSRIKAALFTGNVFAFAIVVALLHRHVGVTVVTTSYFAAIACPLLFLLPAANVQSRRFLAALTHLRPAEIFSTFSRGGWINLITAAWVFQTYALVLIVSWTMGPAAAGTFFLFLKLSDLLGLLGASASEPTIAALAAASGRQDRHRYFATAYRSALALCLTGAAGYTFFCDDLFLIWLHRSLTYSYTGLLIGLFGIAIGFSRIVTAAAVGLSKSRSAALGLLAGTALLVTLIGVMHGRGGPEMLLALSCIAAGCLLPAAARVARDIGGGISVVWLKPVIRFAPRLCLIVTVCAVAQNRGSPWMSAAVVICAFVCGDYIFRPPRSRTLREGKTTLLGYDTRSWRSAIVMKGVDLLNPFHCTKPFAWSGPCVISSVAGLGDLFIHLPLIGGIVNACRARGLQVAVALRPAHVEIGRLCGWDVFPFDNGLEDFFKAGARLRVGELIVDLRNARKRAPALWIDLTGNAISALTIKASGANRIAARVSRGGNSFIDHPLPHYVLENEYDNRARVADYIGCALDGELHLRWTASALSHPTDSIVLCITTASRWKNWPLENFRSLIERFPESRFTVIGFRREVLTDELAELDRIRQQPNVVDQMDHLSVGEMVLLIARCRAVISNDTSAAHIANFFGKPGAVLFGPTSPHAYAAPYGLRVFHDSTCPYHPCVQWTCANQENWCMRKIGVAPVAQHLAAVLDSARPTQRPPVPGEAPQPLLAVAPAIGLGAA